MYNNPLQPQHFNNSLGPPQLGGFHTNGYHPHQQQPMPQLQSPMTAAIPTVPTGTLVEVSPPHPPERKQDPPPPQLLQQPSEHGQWGGPIPLTIKHYEEEQKRKTLVDPGTHMNNNGGGDGRTAMDSWDYVYRELESIGYTKDQADRPDVLQLLLSRVGAEAARQILS